MSLDDPLRDAFARGDPPAGFERRVLARVREEQAARQAAGRSGFHAWVRGALPRWFPAAAAASVIALAAGAQQYISYRQDLARGEAAKAQLIQALRITSAQLGQIQRRLDPERGRANLEMPDPGR
jgi:hypothetical protein